jgi:Ni,Fe-hydrogenase I cytochrome b subunit
MYCPLLQYFQFDVYLLNVFLMHTCRWYAKRFLHPDIVAAYEYIFIWDEDLGVDHFDAEEYASILHFSIQCFLI